ncbi:MAG: hypothetical protein H7061_14520 [Bdellovibrionaceae bacterium]|nr:hypothetical protein [Bdellovibrio sp.]
MHTSTTNDRNVSSESKPSVDQSKNHYAFEQCRSKDRYYLENRIERMPTEYLEPHNNEWTTSIPMKCIQFAQKNFNGNYAKCENEESKPKLTKFKPCQTKNYTNLVYNAFHDVMDCFSLDPKDFYLQFMIESGFHVNAFNKTGMDSGIAQFTANGIKKVLARNRISRTREVLLNSSRPSCSRISSTIGAFDITSFVVERRCSMISVPQNPYRSMFFNYIHTMLDQIDLKMQIDSEISDLDYIREAATDRIKRQFIYLAYNRGMTGIKRLLVGYIDYKKSMNLPITESDLDLNQNLANVKKILKAEPRKREILSDSIREARLAKLSFAEYAVIKKATYVADMVSAQDYVRQHLGDQCSRF